MGDTERVGMLELQLHRYSTAIDRQQARLSALEEHLGEMEAYVDSWGDTGIQLDDWLTKAKEILRGE